MTSPIPGPYFIDEPRAAICSRCERTGETRTLAMFSAWGERDRATASAMVATLDMLATMRALLRHPLVGLCDGLEASIRRTIAAAEGRA